MNLQEQINRIKELSGIDNEYPDLYTKRNVEIINNNKFIFNQLAGSEINVFNIEDNTGSEIGRATLNKDGFLDNIRIDSNYRRIGLATHLYKFIEKTKGIKIKPSPVKQSPEIQKFWNKQQTV
jgi:hypothetical protein